jgi:hypothetical protein
MPTSIPENANTNWGIEAGGVYFKGFCLYKTNLYNQTTVENCIVMLLITKETSNASLLSRHSGA